MSVNVALLRQVLDHITAHPEEHSQGHWAVRSDCGTAYCIAGHVVVMSGYQPDWSTAVGVSAAGTSTSLVAGSDQTIGELAAILLGVEFDAVEDGLFWGGNDLADLWRIASDLTDDRIPDEPPAVQS